MPFLSQRIARNPVDRLQSYTLISLVVLGALAVASHGILLLQVRSNESATHTVNVAGSQRMRSQRAARLLLELVHAPAEADRPALRRALRETIDGMRSAHRDLYHGGDASHRMPETGLEIFGGPRRLDERVDAFIADVDSLVGLPAWILAADPRLGAVLDESREDLIRDLDGVVRTIDSAAQADARLVMRLHLAFLFGTLVTLAGLGGFLLRPLVAQVRSALLRARARERETTLVLEHIHDGLFLVDIDGGIRSLASRASRMWFGPLEDQPHVATLLGTGDRGREDEVRSTWSRLAASRASVESVLAKLPTRVEHGERTFDLTYVAVREGGDLVHVLVCARNVSETVALARSEASAREVQAFVGYALRDRAGAVLLVEEIDALLAGIESTPPGALARRLGDLRSIEVNAAAFGLRSIAERANALANDVLDGRESAAAVEELVQGWAELRHSTRDYLGDETASVALTPSEHAAILRRAAAEGPPWLAAEAQSWGDPRARTVLGHLERLAYRRASEFGRDVVVEVHDSAVRIPTEDARTVLDGVGALLARCIEFGIESPDARQAAGKSPVATVRLGARTTAGGLVLEIEDDGAGEDWREERPGGSARSFLALVERRGGRTDLDTTPGHGTRWAATLPSATTEDGRACA